MLTDTELLDWLDANQRHTWPGRGWICRNSTTGRGLRLHETTREDASSTVREAIMVAMRREDWRMGELEEQGKGDKNAGTR
jgi:hypothetical protein